MLCNVGLSLLGKLNTAHLCVEGCTMENDRSSVSKSLGGVQVARHVKKYHDMQQYTIKKNHTCVK